MSDIPPRVGAVAPEIADELPGLALHWLAVAARDGKSPAALVGRLQEQANRFRGPSVIAMRTKPVPAAYRRFFRQIGLDPDITRPPGEQAALSRLFHGTFRPEGHVADALLVALLETGVPVWALDARSACGEELTIRTTAPGERLGGRADARPISPETLVVADRRQVHAVLFGAPAPDSAVSVNTRELVLYAVSVPGVPAIHVEEAFWLAVEALRGSV
jgi:DNA/RNA-binding domain of Phe-tRNA-synthetase-like protein